MFGNKRKMIPFFISNNIVLEFQARTIGKEKEIKDGDRRTLRSPVPKTHWDNRYVCKANSDNDQSTDRADLPQLILERRPHNKGWKRPIHC